MDEEKVKAIREWPIPQTLTQLRGFLGLCSYYRRFVKNFSKLASPLTDLTKKGNFGWNGAAQEAFEELKENMSSFPVLAIPDFALPFELQCDASGEGNGVVLMQKNTLFLLRAKKFQRQKGITQTMIRKCRLSCMHW